MKHLWNGVAVAAALAFAMPVSAQTAPTAPPSPGAPSAAAAPASAKPATLATAPRQRHARHVAHRAIHRKAHRRRASIANRLNAAELQRIASGAPALPARAR